MKTMRRMGIMGLMLLALGGVQMFGQERPGGGGGGSATNALHVGPNGVYDASNVTNYQGSNVVGAVRVSETASNLAPGTVLTGVSISGNAITNAVTNALFSAVATNLVGPVYNANQPIVIGSSNLMDLASVEFWDKAWGLPGIDILNSNKTEELSYNFFQTPASPYNGNLVEMLNGCDRLGLLGYYPTNSWGKWFNYITFYGQAQQVHPIYYFNPTNGSFTFYSSYGTTNYYSNPQSAPVALSINGSNSFVTIPTGSISSASSAAVATSFGNSISWGRWMWPNTIKAISTSQPFRMLVVGDSLGAPYGGGLGTNGFVIDLLTRYQQVFGDGGYFGMGSGSSYDNANLFYRNLMRITVTGSAYQTNDQSGWFGLSGHMYSSPATITWWSVSNNITANVLKLLYIAKSGAGTFDVWTNVPGSTSFIKDAAASGINADNGGAAHTVILGVYTNTTTGGYRQLMVSNTVAGKTVDFIGAEMLNTTTHGVAYGDMSLGGWSLAEFCALSTNVTGPALLEYNAQFIPVIFYDNRDFWFTNEPIFYGVITNFAPHSDVVILNPFPVTNDTPAGVVGQCLLARTNAPIFTWPLFDGTDIYGNWTNMWNDGFLDAIANVHPNDAGSSFYATALDNWLGLEQVSGRDSTAWLVNQIQGYILNGGIVISNLNVVGSVSYPLYGQMLLGWEDAASPSISRYKSAPYDFLSLRGGNATGANGGIYLKRHDGGANYLHVEDDTGNVVVGATVSAGNFTGNGSGLTGIPPLGISGNVILTNGAGAKFQLQLSTSTNLVIVPQ